MAIAWPALGLPIWEAFRRMGRPPSMNGMEPISAQEIAAYQSVYRVRFTGWELDVIAMFDAIAIDEANKQK